MENLNPLTTYTFRFAVLNEVGASGWDKSLTIKMPEVSSPSEPIISNPLLYNEKYVKSSYATKIELHWNIPSNNGAEIDKYNVKYCRVSYLYNLFHQIVRKLNKFYNEIHNFSY